MKSLAELQAIKERVQQELRLRENQEGIRVVVGMGTCGIAAGARETMGALLDELGKRQIHNVTVTQTGCIGMCEQEPLVDVEIPGQPRVTYGRVNAERARQIVASHIVNGQVIGDWVVNK